MTARVPERLLQALVNVKEANKKAGVEFALHELCEVALKITYVDCGGCCAACLLVEGTVACKDHQEDQARRDEASGECNSCYVRRPDALKGSVLSLDRALAAAKSTVARAALRKALWMDDDTEEWLK